MIEDKKYLTKSNILPISFNNKLFAFYNKIEKHYKILFQGEKGRVAHELILDFRPFKKTAKIDPFLLSKTLIFQRFFSIQTCILVKS